MITYAYWAAVLGLAGVMLYLFGYKLNGWKNAMIVALIVVTSGWLAYVFHFENLFVKRYGGVMSLSTPEGHMHLGTTWKDDNLWVEFYDPEKNICTFSEYSKGNLLQGRVKIDNCNPLLPERGSAAPVTAAP